MAIIGLALLVFVSSDSDSWREFIAPIWPTLTDPRRRTLRARPRGGDPAPARLLRLHAGRRASRRPRPSSARCIPRRRHPSSSAARRSTSRGFDNPLRKDAGGAARSTWRRAARSTSGTASTATATTWTAQGHFAYGFNPPPANFADPGTIADAPGGLLFWRIAKGGPGLPEGIDALELGHAGLGRSAHRGADLAGHHLPLRRHRTAAAPLGVPCRRSGRRWSPHGCGRAVTGSP